VRKLVNRNRPKYSFIVPVYNTDPNYLRTCIDSILQQTFEAWELCIVDDASSTAVCREILVEYAKSDSRIKPLFREQNGGISAASNDAIAIALGEYLVLVDHDDFLEIDALEVINRYVRAFPDVDYLYTDEFHYLSPGVCADFRKPDWSPERFRSQMYTCHLSVIRRDLVERVGRFRSEFDGSQDYDLILRVTEQSKTIVHVPEPLYYWRTNQTSFSRDDKTRAQSFDAGRRAVQEHCRRLGIDAEVAETEFDGVYHVQRKLKAEPKVSIVIPTGGSGGFVRGAYRSHIVACLDAIKTKSTYRNFEFIVVMDESAPITVVNRLRNLDLPNLKIVWYNRPFNFSDKINVGVSYSSAEYLVLMNDDVEIVTENWCEQMLAICQDEQVGSVGCALLFENETIQHLGHTFVDGSPTHIGFKDALVGAGPFGNYATQKEVSGVTAAALLTRKSTFAEVGGFSNYFPNNYNDVDFALKLLRQGYRNIVTPFVRMYHYESSSRDPKIVKKETETINRRWWSELRNDKYVSPLGLMTSWQTRRKPKV
jgi:glycosyltransferase involved in cell wall biosynthesis